MKQWTRITLLLLLLPLFTGCDDTSDDSGSSSDDATPVAASLDGSSWKLMAWSEATPIPAGVTITARFASGQISGSSAVNSYDGPYSASADGTFSIEWLRSTLMGGTPEAMQAESQYLQLLNNACRYRVDGGQLTLSNDSGLALLIYQ